MNFPVSASCRTPDRRLSIAAAWFDWRSRPWALGLGLFWAFSTAPARGVDVQLPGVVVLANRAATPVKFVINAPPRQPRNETLAMGDLVTLTASEAMTVEFSSGKEQVQRPLTANSIYFFLQPDDGPLELHEIGLEQDEPPVGGVQAATVGPIDPQLAAGALTVKLLVDDEQRGARGYWEKRLRKRLDQCSTVLQRQCGLRLEVVALGTWQSGDGLQHASDALTEFAKRVDPAPARLAIGVSSQKLTWNQTELHQSCIGAPLSRHLLIPEYVENMQPDAPFEILLHALGHWLGAAHSPEAGSSMRVPQELPDDFPIRRPLTFDPLAALVMGRVTQEMQLRGISQIGEVTPDCRRQLIAAYHTVQQLMPDDGDVQLALGQLGAASSAAPPVASAAPGGANKDSARPTPEGSPESVPVLFAQAPAATEPIVVSNKVAPLEISPQSITELAGRMAAVSDPVRELQTAAIETRQADWGRWGADPQRYSAWNKHSNRLIPIYAFGATLDAYRGEHSPYRRPEALAELYGRTPDATLNHAAEYFDQSAVYDLQLRAALAGKKNIILMVFDGMDWDTTRAAATYVQGKVAYSQGRGTGLAFQDYRGTETDYGWFVTSPAADRLKYSVNTQKLSLSSNPERDYAFGGYDAVKGGAAPWETGTDPIYHLGTSKERPHVVADSASTATTMCTGRKTYNTGINVDMTGAQMETIAHRLQREGRSVGVVTSVPVSHATPAAAYAHNVERHDYQDLLRDLVGLKSVSHPETPLSGVDVLIGCGWGESIPRDQAQGDNFTPGNAYVTAVDLAALDVAHGGKYRVVQRTSGLAGGALLLEGAQAAAAAGQRLFGLFGVGGIARPGTPGGHLPYQTADGNYNPTVGAYGLVEEYKPHDVLENPTLAQMTTAALTVLERNEQGFWLMVEAGDVDWANHDNNLDNSIGAVHSGDEAFRTLVDWVQRRGAWSDTVLIVTADHGHHLVLTKPETIAGAR